VFDPLTSFFTEQLSSGGVRVRLSASRVTLMRVIAIIIVTQGGKGNCAKVVRTDTKDAAVDAGLPVPSEQPSSTSADRIARMAKAAEEQLPESMSGALPKNLVAALRTVPDFVFVADSESAEPILFKHLYVATFTVSSNIISCSVLFFKLSCRSAAESGDDYEGTFSALGPFSFCQCQQPVACHACQCKSSRWIRCQCIVR
jgi:hypothetical protein